MTASQWAVRRVDMLDQRQIHQLADVLIDCVEGGASVHFMSPLRRESALNFWRQIAQQVAAGERVLLVAEDDQGICGTVQLIIHLPENQPHRAEVDKMLVHRRARRRGLGAALMRSVETTARELHKTLLVLDTVTGSDGARLYEQLGWSRVGMIPNFALSPHGEFCGATIYYRDLSS